MLQNRGLCLRVELPLLGCKFRFQKFQYFGRLADYSPLGPFQSSKKLMRRGNHTSPVLNDSLQMRPTSKAYFDLRGGIPEAGKGQSFDEQKTRVAV